MVIFMLHDLGQKTTGATGEDIAIFIFSLNCDIGRAANEAVAIGDR